jgi:hypothetical protein
MMTGQHATWMGRCGLLIVVLDVIVKRKIPDPLVQRYSTFFVRVPPEIMFLQLCTPEVVGAQFKLYIVYNLHLK